MDLIENRYNPCKIHSTRGEGRKGGEEFESCNAGADCLTRSRSFASTARTHNQTESDFLVKLLL